MEYFIGVILALATVGSARLIGFDRDGAFYPAVLIVIASYYVLFAAQGASARTIGIEIAVASGFSILAVIGYKRLPWLVPAAIAGHGIFDSIHHFLIENPGVPKWWPGFCLSFDVIAGVCLAALMIRRKRARDPRSRERLRPPDRV